MRTILFLLEKEFRQIFRNKTLLPIIFAVPVVQLLILPLAADYEVDNINVAIVDRDHSTASRQLIRDITSSGYFQLTSFDGSYARALNHIASDKADLILEIPPNFERDLVRNDAPGLFIAVNAINGVKAGLGAAYLNSIIMNFSHGVPMTIVDSPSFIDIVPANWYNVHMRYQLFMVPGILAVLVTMIGGYLSALNIVREKETGTIEQINVTPIRKHHFILGKLIPFWILGLFVFTLGLIVSVWVYQIVPAGSLLLLYFFVALYLIAVLGLGLLISTYTETQQQAMLVSFFFVMIFILMSGLFTPIESMPAWAQVISKLNPVTYLIEVMRMVILKGSSLIHIIPHVLAVAVFAVIFNSWAIINYRKTS